MAWPLTGAAGVSLISGLIGANASKKAAATQAAAAQQASANQLQATRESNALNAQMYQQGMVNQSPYMQAGGLGLAALTSGLGLGTIQNTMPNGGAGASGQGNQPTYTNANGQTVDASGKVIQGTQLPIQNYGASNAQLQGAADQNAGIFQQQFKPGDIYQDPSYQWRLQQGQKALESSAAARGQTGSGQNLMDITNYAQNAASQEYQSEWNRWANRQDTAYNRLAGLAGVGQTAANAAGQMGQNAAAQIGQNTMAGAAASSNYLTGGAAAQGAGQVGAANAISGALGSGMNNWMGLQYLNKFAPNGGAPTGTGVTQPQYTGSTTTPSDWFGP